MTAATGNGLLLGTAHDDILIATNGANTETLWGLNGNDIYSYTSGNGLVYISDSGGTDTLKLGGLTASSLSYSEDSGGVNLYFTDGVAGDRFGFGVSQIEYIVYSDGTTEALLSTGLSLTATSGTSTLRGEGGNNTLFGSTGTQTLIGQSGNDTLIAGTGSQSLLGQGGNDTFIGGTGTQFLSANVNPGNDIYMAAVGSTSVVAGTGNDTISYSSGDGTLTISDAGGTDTLKLGSGLTAANVFFTESSNGADLIITDGTSGDQITVKNAITTSADRVEALIYGDGSTLDLT